MNKVGKERLKLYIVWDNIISRCYNPKDDKYRFYGAIGVSVCEEWRNDYHSFVEWALGNGYKIGLHIDKDTKGDGKLYSPDTCCWLTPKENQRARKHLRKVVYEGKEVLLIELCERFGISCRIVKQRMRRDGMTLDQALSVPNIGNGNFINRRKEYKKW